jgi:lysophospholipase L1-like esterase
MKFPLFRSLRAVVLTGMLFPVAAGAGVFKVVDYGAKADGATTNTGAIQRAVDAAAQAGGGEVVLGAGLHLSGAIFLKSNVRLRLEAGAVLRAIPDDHLYPERPTRVAGLEMNWPTALVNVYQQTNVSIGGKGVIDGNGPYWWRKFWGEDGKGGMLKDYQARKLRWAVDYDCKRVRALAVYDSKDITIREVSIERSGFWSLTLTYSERVTVDGVIIRANLGGFGPSSDGIDIDSSREILVVNCDIDCNDDNICLKAGRDWDGLRVNRPTENVVIRNCITRSGHGMLTLGSETSGGIRNVEVSGLRAIGTVNGIRFKSARVRGGVVENIVLRDIVMEGVANPLHFELNWYPSYSYPTLPAGVDPSTMPAHWATLTRHVEPPERGIPEFRNIVISNLTAQGAEQAIYANAYSEKPMRGVRLSDIRIEAQKAGSIANAAEWTMHNVVLATPEGENVTLKNPRQVELPKVIRADIDRPIAGTTAHDPNPLMLGLGGGADEAPPDVTPGSRPGIPTLFLIGDSTVKNGSGQGADGLYGWGQFLGEFFDENKIKVANRARGGRSSRTFQTEGSWQEVLGGIRPGDFVMMQFGHNDGGPLDEGRARASIKGIGAESQVITNKQSGVVETVHSYGWYLRKYIADAKAAGATPIVLSPVPRNKWKSDRTVERAVDYGPWAATVAWQEQVRFIDLNELVAQHYEIVGPDPVRQDYFTAADHTHTTHRGARVNAEIVARAIAQLPDSPLRQYLRSPVAVAKP